MLALLGRDYVMSQTATRVFGEHLYHVRAPLNGRAAHAWARVGRVASVR